MEGSTAAKFVRPLPQSFPASPKALRAFVTSAACRLAEDSIRSIGTLVDTDKERKVTQSATAHRTVTWL
jgi:hypothetical protein